MNLTLDWLLVTTVLDDTHFRKIELVAHVLPLNSTDLGGQFSGMVFKLEFQTLNLRFHLLESSLGLFGTVVVSIGLQHPEPTLRAVNNPEFTHFSMLCVVFLKELVITLKHWTLHSGVGAVELVLEMVLPSYLLMTPPVKIVAPHLETL